MSLTRAAHAARCPLPMDVVINVEVARVGCRPFIMRRLPGADLAGGYPALPTRQKLALAATIVTKQRDGGALPDGPGFGYAHSSNPPTLVATWTAVLDAHLARGRRGSSAPAWLR